MRVKKIARKDDVAVYVTDGLVLCDLLGGAENRVETLCAESRTKDFRLMPETKFAANFRRSFVVAKENDFNVWMKQFPTLKRIALDHVDVTTERLGSGEDGE